MPSRVWPNGRLYVRNLPGWWRWNDVEAWVLSLDIPKPAWRKAFEGEDLSSSYIHWRNVTEDP